MIEFNGKDGDKKPIVAIIMGSDSDWRIMKDAADILESADVPYQVSVKSAHRMPFEMLEFAKTSRDNGFACIIAGAGGAAHLPGMVAAASTLPVIGVPVSLKNLDGMDSLLSIVQMPAGVPVATVSIDGAKNAGLLALRILSATSATNASLSAGLSSGFSSGISSNAASFLENYQAELNKIAKEKGDNLTR